MNPLRQGIKSLLTTVLPRDRCLVSGPRSATGIALTFDDGPHPEHTPRLLDELARHQVRATFFVVGQAVESYPDIARRIVDEGHALGSHTYTHSEPAETSATSLLDEVRRSLDLIEGLTGERPTLFRPPKGKLSITKSLGLWKLRQTIVLWNRDPHDYRADPNEGILPWVEAYAPLGGDIVLLHDTHPHCIQAIKPLVQRVTDSGLNDFLTVDEFVGRVSRPIRAAPNGPGDPSYLHVVNEGVSR